MRGFTTHIDFATGAGFLAAPVLAYHNCRAITASEVGDSLRPSGGMVAWNWLGVVVLAAFAVAFFASGLY